MPLLHHPSFRWRCHSPLCCQVHTLGIGGYCPDPRGHSACGPGAPAPLPSETHAKTCPDCNISKYGPADFFLPFLDEEMFCLVFTQDYSLNNIVHFCPPCGVIFLSFVPVSALSVVDLRAIDPFLKSDPSIRLWPSLPGYRPTSAAFFHLHTQR